MATVVYKGFNTVNRRAPSWSLTDIELVKQDLMNHFQTRIGERVMMPEFGSAIHDLLMDPYDEITEDAVINDVRNVISQDPRVELLSNISIQNVDSGIRVNVELLFKPQDSAEHLILEFKRNSEETY